MGQKINNIYFSASQRIRETRLEHCEQRRLFRQQQKEMAKNKDYHVEPLLIKNIDFMTPLEHWNGLKEIDPILAYIIKRIYQPEPEENCVMMINGSQGSGKSYSAIELGYLTDDGFDVDSICFNLREFKHRIDEGRKTIVLDDLESFAHSRESMTKMNRWLSKTFDMIRFKRNFIIMTAPAFESVEKTLRERTHLQGITKGINPSNKTTILRTFFLDVNPISGDLYRHLPIYFDETRRFYTKIQDIRIREPPQGLIKAYKEKKEEAFLKIANSLDKIDIGAGKKSKSKPKYQQMSDDYVNGSTIKELSAKYELSENTIRKHLSYARDVGYLQERFKESERTINPSG